ncbi:MAG: Uma2 family endonuclease [Hydrococcus sp. RM1_1_31]|nr:Uma2 family endonuclease [Hydrococcus sp. RM1_1_31]
MGKLGIKRDRNNFYAEVEILEYWVVNLKTLQLIVFRSPQQGKYTSKLTFNEGTIQPLAFPDISILVEQIINND